MKIDAFCHIFPPKFKDYLYNRGDLSFTVKSRMATIPSLYNLDVRFKLMEKYDTVQVLTLATANSLDEIASSPAQALELCQRVNDEMAELVDKYPEQFVAGIAVLPFSDIDAALKELDRAINELGLRGLLMFIPILGKAPDLPEFMPIYEMMSRFNLPIFFHPASRPAAPHYVNETESKYDIWLLWGWPYETSVTMARLVFSGVLEKYPNLKIITHHAGGMVPFFSRRIEHSYDVSEIRYHATYKRGLSKAPIEYFRLFYADTCTDGHLSSLMCAYDFFGAEHLLFGTDIPMEGMTREIIQAIEQMNIPDSDKKKIFEDNARKLMRLPII